MRSDLRERTSVPFRLWAPLGFAAPWLGGWAVSIVAGDPMPRTAGTRIAAGLLIVSFVLWNGWAARLLRRARAGLLPWQPTPRLVTEGPYRWSRNPRCLGLVWLYAGLALVAGSAWALASLPLGMLLVTWATILPEEYELRRRFPVLFPLYSHRIRRWM